MVVNQQLTLHRQDLEDKHYATEQSLNNYALKSEIPTPYNDSELVQKIGQLEARVDKDTVYDDTPLKERVTALESKAIEGGAYDDTDLRNRVVALENKPTVDATHFITEETLESKGFLTTHQDISNLATKEELDKRVTKEELEEKHYVTNEQISSTYATKSEIPQPYSDTELVKRITVLENRQDNDTVYDDAELKRRVTALEERPTTGGSVDTSDFVTKKELKEKEDAIYDTMALSPLYKIYTEETIREHLNSEEGFVSDGVDLRGGIIYSNASITTADIFKGDLGKEKFVDFNTAMFTVANSIPDDYSINDLIDGEKDKKVLFLSNKNFSQVVPKEELKAIIKEVLTELKSENN